MRGGFISVNFPLVIFQGQVVMQQYNSEREPPHPNDRCEFTRPTC